MSVNRATAFWPSERERLNTQLVDESGQHPAHDPREPDPGEPVVERLVGDLDPVLVVERAEQVGERFDAPAAQRRYDRQEQPMRRHGAQPFGLSGVATELIHLIDRQSSREAVTQFDKLRGRQGRQRQSPLLVGLATPA
jgi:hypothetical protein